MCGLVGVASADRVKVLNLYSARVGEYVVFLDDEVLGDWILVVNHDDLASHKLKTGIPDCTRVIKQFNIEP